MNNTEKIPNSIKAVIAEDDVIFTLVLEKMLDQLGITSIKTVETETSLLQTTSSYTPDIILMDLNLKGQTSKKIYQKVLEKSDAEILVISGSFKKEIEKKGIQNYLPKPFLFRDFKIRIKEMLLRIDKTKI